MPPEAKICQGYIMLPDFTHISTEWNKIVVIWGFDGLALITKYMWKAQTESDEAQICSDCIGEKLVALKLACQTVDPCRALIWIHFSF